MRKILFIPVAVGTIGVIAGSIISLQKKRTLDEKILEEYNADKVVIFNCKDYIRLEFVFRKDGEFVMIQSDYNKSYFNERKKECKYIGAECCIQVDSYNKLFLHPYDLNIDKTVRDSCPIDTLNGNWTVEKVIEDLKKVYKDKNYYIRSIGELS